MDRTLELIQRVRQGDEDAKEQIVKENMGLIWSIVKKFNNRGCEAEDLFQIGAIGLLKCIDKFDLNYNVKFSTYAVPMIMGEIKRFLRDDGLIKVSRPLKEIALKARYAEDSLSKKNGRQPTISELACALEVTPEDLVMALDAGREVESLYATVHQGEGAPVLLIDKLDQDATSDAGMIDKIALKQIIGKLKPKERQIIFLRYFQDKTQTEIARTVGVSQVQVSRIEKRILEMIRENFG
jgi:RNA polymerase sporulation-specific sigma factor